jgi:hypothetical protein
MIILSFFLKEIYLLSLLATTRRSKSEKSKSTTTPPWRQAGFLKWGHAKIDGL